MPSPILARANALMQRHKSTQDEGDEIPVLTDAIITSEEAPLLTDIDDNPLAILPELTAPTQPPQVNPVRPATTDSLRSRRQIDPEMFAAPPLANELLRDLAWRVENRLQEALPRLIADCLAEMLADLEQQTPPPEQ